MIICPEYIIALLRDIDRELQRIMWNKWQRDYDSPFANTGNQFINTTFSVYAYDWHCERQEYNFKYKDIEIGWYKYLGRGTCINKEITANDAIDMYNACISSLRKMEERNCNND